MLFHFGQHGFPERTHGVTFQRFVTRVTFSIQLHDSTIPGPGTDPRQTAIFDFEHVLQENRATALRVSLRFPSSPNRALARDLSKRN